MAETLTYSESEPTGSEEVTLNESEQEALQVGEQLEKEQGNAKLAGKFESPEQLEKAYMELQSKLGSRDEIESEEEEEYAEQDEDEEYDSSFLDEIYEQAKGEPSDEFVEKLNQMEVSELADMYVQYREQVEQNQTNQSSDFSNEEVEGLYGLVGGKEQYGNLMSWAVDTLSPQEVQMFDAVMDRGDANAAYWAIRSLAMQYADANGYEGNRISGKAPRNDSRQFKSQAELVQAMADPRYDKDEAYRAEIMSKLSDSNLNF
tara:strand:+ start:445 stop:1227 length:783 start_codon:yes stop_codon:yes gene_type:complete